MLVHLSYIDAALDFVGLATFMCWFPCSCRWSRQNINCWWFVVHLLHSASRLSSFHVLLV